MAPGKDCSLCLGLEQVGIMLKDEGLKGLGKGQAGEEQSYPTPCLYKGAVFFCAILKDRTCPGEAVFLGMKKRLSPQGTGSVRRETPALGETGRQVKDAEPVREPVRSWRVGIGVQGLSGVSQHDRLHDSPPCLRPSRLLCLRGQLCDPTRHTQWPSVIPSLTPTPP